MIDLYIWTCYSFVWILPKSYAGEIPLGGMWLFMILKIIYIVVALFLGTAIFLYQKFVRIVVNLFLGISIRTSPPEKLERASEHVHFKATDGTRLAGFFWRGAHHGDPKGAILFCHEFSSHGTSALIYADFLLEAGYDLFAFDFRGHGDSHIDAADYEPRHWTTCREVSDVQGAIAYLKSRPDVHPDRIGIFGVSRGGASALAAAACGDIRAVFCDSTFSTWTTLKDYMYRWVSIYAYVPIIYNNLPRWFFSFLAVSALKISELRLGVRFIHLEKVLKQYRGAAMFVHGARDTYIRDSQAKCLSDMAEGPSSYHIFAEAKHNGARFSDGETYVQLVAEFFQKYLTAEKPAGVSLQARGS